MRNIFFRALAEQAAHETDTFFPAYLVGMRRENLVGEYRPVASQNDACLGRVSPDQLHHASNFVKGGHNEIDPHIVVDIGLQLANELPLGRVMQGDTGGLDVLGDVVDGPATNDLSDAENPLRPRHLRVKELCTNGISFAGSTKRPADGG